jgi:hypothetical protein
MTFDATVKATNEKLIVYRLNNGNYYDYQNMGANQPPAAPKAGKKEFKADELNLVERKEV